MPDSDPPSPPVGPAQASPASAVAAAAVREADPATRMAIRRHPVVVAAIMSAFVARTLDIAAAANRARQGNLDLPLIRTLARDLRQDLDRARTWTRVRHLKPGITITDGAALVLAPDQALGQAPGPYSLIRYFDSAIALARELDEEACTVLGSPLSLRTALYGGGDLDMARELAEILGADLTRVVSASEDDRAREQALGLARKRSRDLDQLCAQNQAGRLGIAPAEGLAEAVLRGALDDFTTSDLTHASRILAGADLAGLRWSLAGTSWPAGTDVKALVARSEEVRPGSGILAVTHTGTMWQPAWQGT